MKIFSALFLLAMLSLVSCGGKGGGGGNSSGVFTNALSTQEGYLNLNTQNLEFGGQIYTPQMISQNQQNVQILNYAYSTARNSGIQPILVNGGYKYRARMTAQVSSPYYTNGYGTGYPNGYGTGYTNPNPNPYTTSGSYGGAYGQGALVIQSIVFY